MFDGNPISRSRAKTLCFRLDEFESVTIDFEVVELMGREFADELFRVFQSHNPDLKIEPTKLYSLVA